MAVLVCWSQEQDHGTSWLGSRSQGQLTAVGAGTRGPYSEGRGGVPNSCSQELDPGPICEGGGITARTGWSQGRVPGKPWGGGGGGGRSGRVAALASSICGRDPGYPRPSGLGVVSKRWATGAGGGTWPQALPVEGEIKTLNDRKPGTVPQTLPVEVGSSCQLSRAGERNWAFPMGARSQCWPALAGGVTPGPLGKFRVTAPS